MLIMATAKALKNPIPKADHSGEEKCGLLLNRSKAVAANIVGTASKNENSTIVFRWIPKISPPIIVAAARETPGTMAKD